MVTRCAALFKVRETLQAAIISAPRTLQSARDTSPTCGQVVTPLSGEVCEGHDTIVHAKSGGGSHANVTPEHVREADPLGVNPARKLKPSIPSTHSHMPSKPRTGVTLKITDIVLKRSRTVGCSIVHRSRQATVSGHALPIDMEAAKVVNCVGVELQ